MKNTNNLNLKNMIKIYTETGEDDRERLWDTFHNLMCFGFITWETWTKFYNKCCDLPMTINAED